MNASILPTNGPNFDFYFRSLDTLVRLETSLSGSVIRADRNSFSEARKLSFIRELIAEGFIECAAVGSKCALLPVRWVVDSSWLRVGPNARRQTDRFMYRLIGGALLLWLVLMGVLIVTSGPGH